MTPASYPNRQGYYPPGGVPPMAMPPNSQHWQPQNHYPPAYEERSNSSNSLKWVLISIGFVVVAALSFLLVKNRKRFIKNDTSNEGSNQPVKDSIKDELIMQQAKEIEVLRETVQNKPLNGHSTFKIFKKQLFDLPRNAPESILSKQPISQTVAEFLNWLIQEQGFKQESEILYSHSLLGCQVEVQSNGISIQLWDSEPIFRANTEVELWSFRDDFLTLIQDNE